MRLFRILLTAVLLLMAAGIMHAQQPFKPQISINSGFSPRDHIDRLAQAKAQQLDRQRTFEKLYQPAFGTNWQEYDICYYDIDWRIDDTNQAIYGSVGIYGNPTVSYLDTVVINLDNGLTVDSIYESSGALPFDHNNNHITVYLGWQYNPAEQFGFTVVYHGQPQPGPDGHEGLSFASAGGTILVYNSSEPYHSRQWWPCNDIPFDKADSVDIRVTVDTSLTVSSNGLLVSDIDNGDATRTLHWKHRYPISTYLVCLGVHNYVVWEQYYNYSPTDSMPIVNYVFPSEYENSLDTFSVTPFTIGLFAGLFGEYPFIDERYGHTHSYILGMEYQTNTFISPMAYQETVVHEIAHQWWGDLVTCQDWPNIWLNEGFATYCEGLYYEAVGGPDLYHYYMDDITYLEYPPGHTIYVEDTSSVWNIFTSRVYRKGAWVLHMLRHITGDETFYDIMNEYRARFAFGTAVTEDFQAACEDISGMDLDYYFQQWIYGRCQPTYRHSFYTEENPGGGWDTYVHLRQIQSTDPQVFVMPLDLRFKFFSDDNADFVVMNDQREQDFFFHTDGHPQNVSLDPDKWVLCLESWEQYGLRILNDDLADGVQGEPYVDSVIAKGGYPGYDIIHKVIDGEFPTGLELGERNGVISGTTYTDGEMAFTIEVTDEYYPASFADTMTYSIYFEPVVPRPGDANFDSEINVGDVVYLINYIFKSGPPPAVANWADVNVDCSVNVGDGVYLIAFIFNSGPDPQLGCIE